MIIQNLEEIEEVMEREIHLEHRGKLIHIALGIYSFIYPKIIEVFLFEAFVIFFITLQGCYSSFYSGQNAKKSNTKGFFDRMLDIQNF